MLGVLGCYAGVRFQRDPLVLKDDYKSQIDLGLDTQLSGLPKTPSISSLDDSPTDSSTSSDPETDNSKPELRRSSRVRIPTRDKVSQLSQEAAAAAAKARKEKRKGKGYKMRKSIPTSQLLVEFGIDLQ